MTELLYLKDFDVTACQAQIIDISPFDDKVDIVLDQTCFYPRGGGQDWDTGIISSQKAEFRVSEVRLDQEGLIHHIGQYAKGDLEPGDEVACEVDQVRRHINTRLHSAGHMLDMVMSEIRPNWKPARGAHYSHMSFVEYAEAEQANIEPLIKDIQIRIDKAIKSDYQNRLIFVTKDELANYCRHVPHNLPTNKPTRIVLYADDFGIPCGGTHVRSVSQIGKVNITKLKIKKGLAKVSYAVEGIN